MPALPEPEKGETPLPGGINGLRRESKNSQSLGPVVQRQDLLYQIGIGDNALEILNRFRLHWSWRPCSCALRVRRHE